jgi:polyisoprenoid-binding protein YceI
MKKILFIALAGMILVSCNQAPKTAQEAGEVSQATQEAAVYKVDVQNSVLNWTGAKITQTVHYGTVRISEGSLAFNGEQLEAGNFVIDMTSIVVTDLNEENGKLKLEGHLKSGDFFMTEQYPTAKFEVTGASALTGVEGATHTITGNLTIKDVTNGISFPANVSVMDGSATATAKFTINRNEWGVVWGGTKTEQGIKDFLQNNLIKDEIEFDVKLSATK